MKKYLFLVALFIAAVTVYGQSASAQKVNGPVISFEKKTHDFGQIVQGDKVEETFRFTNTGSEPLMITNVHVTCGCTVPKYSKDPILPGGKGEVTVAFSSAGKLGAQNKVVTVISNAVNADGGIIKFTANIVERKQPN